MNEQDLLIVGARVRLAEIEAEAAELRKLLNGAAPAQAQGSHLVPDATKKVHWRHRPENAEKAAAQSRKMKRYWAKRRREARE